MNQIRFIVSPRIMGEEKFFGPGIAALLHRVETYHSIRQATLSMGMAYSKAWAMIRLAEEGLGGKIVERRAGGKDGGGADVTERGRKLTELYQRYEDAVRNYSVEKYREIFLESGFFQQEE